MDPSGHALCDWQKGCDDETGLNNSELEELHSRSGAEIASQDVIEATIKPVLKENGWDFVPVVSDVRSIIRGFQRMDVAFGQPGFLDEQVTLQTWYNNCYGVCHGSGSEAGLLSGGPMPNTPLVDMYSQGMGEAASGTFNLLMTAALVVCKTCFDG